MDVTTPAGRRLCSICGAPHLQRNSPICAKCRQAGSKKVCPIAGCTTVINAESRTCLSHRSLQNRERYTKCAECGCAMPPSVSVACGACRESVVCLCACGCGRYRKKYDRSGDVREYVSGHNDVWEESRRPLVPCAVCGAPFRAATTRQRICSIECRTEWMRLNPPNARKVVRVECAVCGAPIYRAPHQFRSHNACCSQTCRDKWVGDLMRQRITLPRRLALQRDESRCRVCGFDALVEVHHIKPRHKGGKDALDNLITLCPNHHTMADRGLLSPEELRGHLDGTAAMEEQDRRIR